MLASDMRRMKIAVGMAGAGVIHCHKGRRDQAGMQNGSILSPQLGLTFLSRKLSIFGLKRRSDIACCESSWYEQPPYYKN